MQSPLRGPTSRPSLSWLLTFQNSFGASFLGNFPRPPLSKVWCLLSKFAQPWAWTSSLTAPIPLCPSVMSCSNSWTLSYPTGQLLCLAKFLGIVGIQSTVLADWTNEWGKRTEVLRVIPGQSLESKLPEYKSWLHPCLTNLTNLLNLFKASGPHL